VARTFDMPGQDMLIRSFEQAELSYLHQIHPDCVSCRLSPFTLDFYAIFIVIVWFYGFLIRLTVIPIIVESVSRFRDLTSYVRHISPYGTNGRLSLWKAMYLMAVAPDVFELDIALYHSIPPGAKLATYLVRKGATKR